MKILVRGHNLKVTPAIKAYAEKKISKLEDYFDQIIEVIVELEVRRTRDISKSQVAKINVKLPKHVVIRAEAASEDLYASIDMLLTKVDAPLKKYHDKLKDSHRKMNFFSRVRRVITQDYSDLEPVVKIIKEPKAALKPMDPIEAVLQLNKSKESFYVFNNSKTHHQISIVYDRKNGTYGLQTFRDAYLKRIKLKNFKDMPANKKYEGSGVKITKIKDIDAKPMTPKEAAARLANSKDLQFMPFIDPETNTIKVIYKKKQPLCFGLIEPVM